MFWARVPSLSLFSVLLNRTVPLIPSALLIVLSAVFLAACGGAVSNHNSNTPPPPPPGPGSPPGQAVTVNVSGGTAATGIDIAVAPPAASPPPNAQFLGVGGKSAFGTGAQIHQGTTATVFLFGPGLSGNMTVKISGPSDVTVANVRTITATDQTPGVAFDATVAGSAGLGGRTVLLMNPQNDITTFTGGLEVIP